MSDIVALVDVREERRSGQLPIASVTRPERQLMLDTNDRAIAIGDRLKIVGNRRKSKETVAMNKWILSAGFLALAAAPVAASDVRLDSYRNPKNETFRNFNQVYLDGVRSGLIAYNARIKSLGGQPAFCMPGNLAMTTDQTEEIMLKSADKRAAKGDMLIALLLLSGLRDSFPCEKTGSQ